jgi:hypothetical protein
MNTLLLISKHWCSLQISKMNAYAFGYETPRNQRDHEVPG